MARYSLLLLISFSMIFGCKNSISPDLEKIIVKSGTFFGFCFGYCRTELQVDGLHVTFIASGWTEQFPDRMIEGKLSYDEWLQLHRLLDTDIFYALDDVYGCPDCADGGGEWIELIDGDQVKKVTFEYGDTVASIDKLIAKLRTLRQRYYDQMFPPDNNKQVMNIATASRLSTN